MSQSDPAGKTSLPNGGKGRPGVFPAWGETRYLLLLAGIALFLSLHIVYAGVPPQEIYSHDATVFYDGGWKVYCGVRPSVDFYSPLGPVIYLFVAAGFCLFGVNVDSMAYMYAISLPAFMALVWSSLRARVPAFWLFWLALLIPLCLVAEHPPEVDFWRLSYAMSYNRHGYAWLMLLVALLYSPAGRASPRQLQGNAILAGLILSILLFLKISYFLGALPFFLVRALLREKSVLDHRLVVAAFGGLSLIFLAYLHFDVVAIGRDLLMASRARADGIVGHKIMEDILVSRWQIVIVLVMVAVTWRKSAGDSSGSRWDDALIPAVFLGASFFILETNAAIPNITNDLPLVPVLFILLIVRNLAESDSLSAVAPREPGRPLLAASLGLVMCVLYIVPDAGSILCSVYKVKKLGYTPFGPGPMHQLLFAEVTGETPYAAQTNDGVRLLRENHLQDLRITSLDFSMPLAFALHSPPPVGTPTFWCLASNISPTVYPDQNRAFHGVDVIMIPKVPDVPSSTDLLEKIYGDYLKDNFTQVAESSYWTVLRRTRAEPSGARDRI